MRILPLAVLGMLLGAGPSYASCEHREKKTGWKITLAGENDSSAALVRGKGKSTIKGRIAGGARFWEGCSQIHDLDLTDFDFDGLPDISRCQSSGAYGVDCSYWLYEPDSGKFRYSKEFSDTLGNLQAVDAERKLVVISAKSGCCIHWTNAYRPQPGRHLLLVKEAYSGPPRGRKSDGFAAAFESDSLFCTNRVVKESGEGKLLVASAEELRAMTSEAAKLFAAKQPAPAYEMLGTLFSRTLGAAEKALGEPFDEYPHRVCAGAEGRTVLEAALEPKAVGEQWKSAVNDYAYYAAEAGRYEEARSLLERILKKWPQRLVAHLNLADTLYAMGERCASSDSTGCAELKDAAKQSYRRYREGMEKRGELEKVPERVARRLE